MALPVPVSAPPRVDSATLSFSTVAGGTIEVDSGVLVLPNSTYPQGGGALNIALDGFGAGRSGQLAVSGSATLNGPLNAGLSGTSVMRFRCLLGNLASSDNSSRCMAVSIRRK